MKCFFQESKKQLRKKENSTRNPSCVNFLKGLIRKTAEGVLLQHWPRASLLLHDISSPSARLNQYYEQRRFRPSSLPDPEYDKYTQTHIHTNSNGDILIHLSQTESLALDGECVTPWQETHCFIMESEVGGGWCRLISVYSISHSLVSLQVIAKETTVYVPKEAVCWLCPLPHHKVIDGVVWCPLVTTRWHCGTHAVPWCPSLDWGIFCIELHQFMFMVC